MGQVYGRRTFTIRGTVNYLRVSFIGLRAFLVFLLGVGVYSTHLLGVCVLMFFGCFTIVIHRTGFKCFDVLDGGSITRRRNWVLSRPMVVGRLVT